MIKYDPPGDATGALVGHEVEGRVASALWDITDDSNDTVTSDYLDGVWHDTLSEMDDEIVEILRLGSPQPGDFSEFHDSWDDRYSDSTLSIMRLHGMDFAFQLPVANSQYVRVSSGDTISIRLEGSDPEGDDISFILDTSPSHGDLSINNNAISDGDTIAPRGSSSATLVYSADPGISAQDSFMFYTQDDWKSSDSARVHVAVTPVGQVLFSVHKADRTTLNLQFDMDIGRPIGTNDIEVSPGRVTGVSASPVLGEFNVSISGVPLETPVTLTYVGESFNLPGNIGQVLHGTSSTSRPTDTTPPKITAPEDMSFTTTETTIILTEVDYGTANATDNVDPFPVITNNATNPFDIGDTVILWTATDDAGNFDTDTQTITVIHSSLAITAPPDITREATGPTMAIDIGTANATHDTDTDLTIMNDAPPEGFPVGTTTVTWNVTDSSLVTAMDTQLVTVQDTTAPAFGTVQDLDFVFEPDVPIVINYDSPTATDIVDSDVSVVCAPASGTIFGEGATAVTCTATDGSGNTARVTFDVSVLVFSTTIFYDNFEDGNMDGWTLAGDHELWNAMPLDEPAYPPNHPSTNKVAQAVLCEVVCVMSMTGFDLSGHADPEFLQFYRYVDDSLDAGAYLSVEIYDGSSWTELGRWSMEGGDNDDIWHLEEYSLSDYTEVTDFGVRFTVFSDAFNEAVGIDDVKLFIVPVPVVSLAVTAPADVTAEAAGVTTQVSIGTATTSGGSGDITITNDAASSFPLGSTTITWTATDSEGATATDTQVILVRDTTAPSITAPADVSFTTTTGTSLTLTPSDYGTATATDLVDPSPAITSDAANPFQLGATTITWTATDSAGNTATATQRVTVTQSSLRITVPADITAEATGTTTAIDIGTANATHDTDTNLTISNNAASTLFPIGVTTITWTVVDSSGTTVTDTQRITVRDTTAPAFESVQDLDFVFEEDVPIVINYDSPTATDIVDDSVTVSCTPASGTVFGERTTEVTCTATDDAGNTANATFDVSVTVLRTTIFHDAFETGNLAGWNVTDYSDTWDSYPPEGGVNPSDHPAANKVAQVSWCDITCTMSISGFNLSVYADPEFLQLYRYVDDELDNGEYLSLEVYNGTAWAELDRWTPEESDDDDVWHLEEYSLSNYTGVSNFGMRFTAVMSSLDEAVAIDDVRIFILPPPAPPAPPSNATALAVTAPADVTAEAAGTTTQVSIGTATASGGSGNYTITSNATNPFPLGTTTILWTATDSEGATATDIQRITVQDTTAPAFDTAPADISRSFPTGATTEVVFATPTATDLVDSDVSVVCTPASGTVFQPGDTTVTCTATDDHSNSATASFTVSVTAGEVLLYPPTSMKAKATDSEIVLTWRPPNVVAADSYQILRDSGSGMVVLVNDTLSAENAFVDYAAAPGTSYSYQVKAITPHGLSPSSSIVTATTHQSGHTGPAGRHDCQLHHAELGLHGQRHRIRCTQDRRARIHSNPRHTVRVGAPAHVRRHAGVGKRHVRVPRLRAGGEHLPAVRLL